MQYHMYLKDDPHNLIPIEFGKPEDYEARQAMIESIEAAIPRIEAYQRVMENGLAGPKVRELVSKTKWLERDIA